MTLYRNTSTNKVFTKEELENGDYGPFGRSW